MSAHHVSVTCVLALTFALSSAAHAGDLERASAQAARFCSMLDCPRPVLLQHGKLRRGILGGAERRQAGGCLLTFTTEGTAIPLVVAHEVCHCTFDYELLAKGWDRIDKAERARREKWAWRCAERLTDGTWGKR